MINFSKSFLSALCLLLLISPLYTQEKKGGNKIDSSYITSFPNSIMGRIYFSRKYTNLTIEKESGGKDLKYEPNSTVNFGLGITVKGFSLNLAYGFKGLNNERKNRGKTDYLDLQSQIYKRTFVIDIFAQIYDGLFLSNTSTYTPDFGENFYLRPDIKVRLFGFSALRVYNSERFSYAAPFVQNELQHKSSGSLLYGVNAVALLSTADSNYTPSFVDDSLYKENYDVKRMQAIQIGPNIGYAHSIIIGKRLFITASLNLALVVGPVKYVRFDNNNKEQWQVNPSFGARFAFGYNSPKWYLGFTALQGGTQLKTLDEDAHTNVGAGTVRFVYVRRFTMGKKLKKAVDKLPL